MELWPQQGQQDVGLAWAWAMRQRDPLRVRAALPRLRLDAAPDARLRLDLIDAELLLHAGDAAASAALALTVWEAADGDSSTRFDAALLLAGQALLQGHSAQAEDWLGRGLALPPADATRLAIAELWLALVRTYRDPQAGRRRGAPGDAELLALPAPSRCWAHELRGTLAAQASDYGVAAAERMQAYALAIDSGQLQRAVVAAQNAADALNQLQEHELAMQWLARSLALCRPRGWKLALGLGLGRMGDTLCRLGRAGAADEALTEAESLLAGLPLSRLAAIVLKYRADWLLAQARHDTALAAFQRLQTLAEQEPQPDLQVHAARGQSQALRALGRDGDAREAARRSLQLARDSGHGLRQIEALCAMAELQADAPPYGLPELEQALALGKTLPGYQPGGDLLDALAEAHARHGELARAYALARAAAQARLRSHGHAANQRLVALQVEHQTERARAEAEHLRRLNEAQQQRAADLERGMALLAELGERGRAITAGLQLDGVLHSLAKALDEMLGMASAQLHLTDGATARSLGAAAWQAPTSTAALLAAPLLQGTQQLGILQMQARQPRPPFDDSERLVFSTLCAYTAIALDNVATHGRLHLAQQTLARQEKQAALGRLVAGVAHELNTPIGNALLSASDLRARSAAMAARLRGEPLRRQELVDFLGAAAQGGELLERGLQRAADLVHRFKQVAADPQEELAQRFALSPLCEQVLAPARAMPGLRVELALPPGLVLRGYPDTLRQVLEQLVDNALRHGLAGRATGRLTLSAALSPARQLLLRVHDDGAGIAAAHLAQVFDPFFSTRFGQGGSGLGLYICHNLVEHILKGSIRVRSEPGKGCDFELLLPAELD